MLDFDKEHWKINAGELRQRQSLPLRMKIIYTLGVIHQWYESWDGEVAVAFSGGKDSTVLLDIIRKIYPDVPAVFADTGLDYPEIKEFVKKQSNVIIMKPKIPFHKIIQDYGYPVVSKKVSFMVSMCQRPHENNVKSRTLYLTGVNSHGEKSGFTIPKKYRYLINAQFKISSRCCDFIKKYPLSKYEQQTKRKLFVGTMASDSRLRENAYLQTGCNTFTGNHQISRPLAIWTEQDTLQYCIENNIEICSVYGSIEKTESGFKCSKMDRTGCMFCLFGMYMESEPNRFQSMAITHPNQYNYCINKLKMGEIMDYLGIKYEPNLRTSRWN